ncbi:hypothetical protein SERLA73DRAFT_174662 [Serpula lacrymans var. lacrymans S7.3]|uniref:Uncharacterized protein n=2 Tax=Serpula lacrymans var. lacrymans TaxID=341189 RepID=F8PJ34_SERL3|nr:uncharacterized protein SERLADRAFT_456289 [Serpula lacrymans var. lacrymans S7.9]EGO03195.1 hypothetical protein SERLA73DRAFT_174662 [Serpula lacrymans var. lacrymans S7.3]EGO28973.1 hypothetical protein SERLADRAFT_456289 [Serpula lacrymans var. lacrymans S7.9]
MADNFPITTAQIVGLFMECILYGIYLVTLVQCLRALLWSDSNHALKEKINYPMLVVTLLLCTFATLDVAFGLRHNLVAFVYYTGQGGATAEFEDISYWVNVMKTVDYVMQTLIGDAMLTYRCYLVYGRNWKIIIPSSIIWLASLACGIALIVTFATLNTSALLNVSQAEPFLNSGLGTTLGMNIITTSLIVYRIWSVDRQTASMTVNTNPRRGSRLKHVVHILVESAALYTVSVLIFVCTYAASSNANYGTSDNVVQIIGISFNLIIIRITSGRSFENMTAAPTLPTIEIHKRSTMQDSFPLSTFRSSQGIVADKSNASSKLPRLQINVSHDVDYAMDDDSVRAGTSVDVDMKPGQWDGA